MRRILVKALITILPVLIASGAYAGSLSLTLNRLAFSNVVDAAGLWQHEGGTVLKGATQIGNYAISRRVTTGGTEAQNTAALTVTIFFLGATPPDSITLQGTHSFSTGGVAGSVSAASSKYDWIRSASFAGNTKTLTLTWLGSNSLTLP
jgi:hypothetical protein